MHFMSLHNLSRQCSFYLSFLYFGLHNFASAFLLLNKGDRQCNIYYRSFKLYFVLFFFIVCRSFLNPCFVFIATVCLLCNAIFHYTCSIDQTVIVTLHVHARSAIQSPMRINGEKMETSVSLSL